MVLEFLFFDFFFNLFIIISVHLSCIQLQKYLYFVLCNGVINNKHVKLIAVSIILNDPNPKKNIVAHIKVDKYPPNTSKKYFTTTSTIAISIIIILIYTNSIYNYDLM